MVFQWVGVGDTKKRAKISLIGCGGDIASIHSFDPISKTQSDSMVLILAAYQMPSKSHHRQSGS